MNIITPPIQVELVEKYLAWEQSGKNSSAFDNLLETVNKIRLLINCPEDLRETFNLMCSVTPELTPYKFNEVASSPTPSSSSSTQPVPEETAPSPTDNSSSRSQPLPGDCYFIHKLDLINNRYERLKMKPNPLAQSRLKFTAKEILQDPDCPEPLRIRLKQIFFELESIELECNLVEYYEHFKKGHHPQTLTALKLRIKTILEGPYSAQLKAKAETILAGPYSTQLKAKDERIRSEMRGQGSLTELEDEELESELDALYERFKETQHHITLRGLELRIETILAGPYSTRLKEKAKQIQSEIDKPPLKRLKTKA